MITKSVNAGCRSETTLNTFSDHDGSPGRLELPDRPLATPHTAVPRSSPNATQQHRRQSNRGPGRATLMTPATTSTERHRALGSAPRDPG
jgi:hypothetical protein